jgi:hypothetical protein
VKAQSDPKASAPVRKVWVTQYSGPGCPPCKTAKEKLLPALEAMGYTIQELCIERSPQLAAEFKKVGVTAYPTFWFVEEKDPETGKAGRSFKQVGGFTVEHMRDAIKAVPPPATVSAPAVSARELFKIKPSELLKFVRGKKFNYKDRVVFEIPADMRWQATVTDTSVIVTFLPPPRGYISIPILPDWRTSLQGFELTTRYVEAHVANLPDGRVGFDWLCDKLVEGTFEPYTPDEVTDATPAPGDGIIFKPGLHNAFGPSGETNGTTPAPSPPEEARAVKPAGPYQTSYTVNKPVSQMSNKEYRRTKSLVKWGNPSFTDLRAARLNFMGAIFRPLGFVLMLL